MLLLLICGAHCYRRVTGSADSGCVFFFPIGVCLMVYERHVRGSLFDLT
jgi:hypothetical protein